MENFPFNISHLPFFIENQEREQATLPDLETFPLECCI
jgi:hypothetical protein